MRLPGLLKRRVERAIREVRSARIAKRVVRAGPRVKAERHSLPGTLILSLTSYPLRFPTLHLTLTALLRQTVRPDRVVLWLGYGDAERLPEAVTRLQDFGLEIRSTTDFKAYTKLIPSLISFPDAYIVTADDDIFYPEHWLQGLITPFDSHRPQVICHRAHRPRFTHDGRLAPYKSWSQDVQEQHPSRLLFPTGVGGVLYPPGLLDTRVTDSRVFTDLCPLNDDIWLYFMGLMNGVEYLTSRSRFRIVEWNDTQDCALFKTNVVRDANDEQIRNLEDHFGLLKC